MSIIKDIWKNKKLIWQGFINTIFKKRYVEKIANERAEICKACEFYDPEGKDCGVPGTQPCCANCGCSIALKTRSLAAECPVGKWEAVEKDEDEEEELVEFDLNSMDDEEKVIFAIEVLESCDADLSFITEQLHDLLEDEDE